jgi:hypothetical protein
LEYARGYFTRPNDLPMEKALVKNLRSALDVAVR